MDKKPVIAILSLTCCEGCQVAIFDLGERFLEFLTKVNIGDFRLAEDLPDVKKYDIAIVEGSITRDSDIPRLQKIRDTAKILITLGACAHIAGINALKNFQSKAEYQSDVYPTDPGKYETAKARAIHEIVKVDAFIPGCPIDTGEFVRVVKNLVLGKDPAIPTYPVCVECKKNENICVYEKGIQCLGPIIRAGCGARCPSNGGYCFGCRGVIPEPNLNSQQDIMQKYNLTFDQMKDKLKLFLQRNKEVFSDVE